MPLYLDETVTLGLVEEYRQAFPPSNPQPNAIWFQTGGNPNSVWIWNQSLGYWLSAAGYPQSESLNLVATNPAFSGRVQLLSVQQSIAPYGLFVAESLLTGQTSVNNDAANNWSFQFQCGSNLALPITTAGLIAGLNSVVGRAINSVLLADNPGKIVEVVIKQTGVPGDLTGILSSSYRFVYG